MRIALIAWAVLLQPTGLQTTIPAAFAKPLSAAYPGWQLANIPRDPRDAELGVSNVLRGDYDGDGRIDYAALINYENRGSGSARSTQVVALLDHVSGPQVVPVSKVMEFRSDDDLILRPTLKGSMGYDLGTDKEFVYERDAITVQPSDSGPCSTFIYRNGQFASIWTCD